MLTRLWQLRDITQIFVSRAELIPAGETTEEHRAQQEEEASRVDQDKAIGATTGKGLFGVRFWDSGPRRIPIIRDEEDGVDRCPRCTWELEDGWCESCGYGTGDHSDMEMSDSEMSFYVRDDLGDDLTVTEHPMMGDDISIYETDFPEGTHAHRNHATLVDSDGNTLDEELDTQAHQVLGRARVRNRRDMRILRNLERWHDRGLHGSSSSVGYDEDNDNFPDEQYSSDDTAGSLNDFIADDQAERPALEDSPQSSRSSFDPGTEAEMDSDVGYAGRETGTYEPHLDGSLGREDSMADLQRDSDDEPDEGLDFRRRLIEASAPLDSDEDADIIAMHASRLHGQRNGRRSNRSMAMNSSERNQHGYSPDYRMIRGGGRSQQAPIEIGSDSDIPMPIPRSRRSRPVVASDSSDGSDAENRNRSAISGTARRLSPPPPRHDGSTTRGVQRKRKPVSYFVQSPSPVLAPMVEEGNDVDWDPPLSPSHQSRQMPGDEYHESDASSSGSRTHLTAAARPSDNTSRSPHSNRRNRATAPRRTHGRISPGRNVRSRVTSLASSHPTGRAPRPETSTRMYDSDEARAAAKAERKRMKRERRLRNREMTSVAS